MPRIVRGQLALECGDRLQDAGSKLHTLSQYSGPALKNQQRLIQSSLSAELQRLTVLVNSCRAAKNSYPNYPALRKVLAAAGDQVYELRGKIILLISAIDSPSANWTAIGNELMDLGQQLKLVSFVPPEREEVEA